MHPAELGEKGARVLRKASRLARVNSGTYTYSNGAYVVGYPTGSVSRMVRRADTNAPLILGPVGARHVVLEDLELDGNNPRQTANNAHVVHLADAPTSEDTQWTMWRCYVHGRVDPSSHAWGNGGSNVYIGAGRMACHVLSCVTNNANVHGFEINGADAVIDTCIVRLCCWVPARRRSPWETFMREGR